MLSDLELSNTVKKQTRQWAAWTRQEEENFFTALRQVGKACCIHFVICIRLFSLMVVSNYFLLIPEF